MKVPVEICAQGLASALAAGEGGAARVELCESLAGGGVTPSAGAIAVASAQLSIPVHVLIRPRGHDHRFIYSTPELEAMRRDIDVTKQAGASGVVLGLLTPKGRVDVEGTARLVERARPLSVTFHKAFDASRDPYEAIEDLIGIGVDRVLTSGFVTTALEGLETLRGLTRQAGRRIVVMAGGSIHRNQIKALIAAGLREIHIGSNATIGGVTDAGEVRRIVEEATMTEVYHITTRTEWDLALAHGAYRPPSLATEGFIHASTGSQVAGTAHRFFRGVEGLVVLKIDLDRVTAPVDWSNSPHSTDPFPHIVGALNLDAVTGTLPLEPSPDGEFRWPPDGAPREE